MFYTLDRFEGEYAVLVSDNKESVSVLVSLLPQDAAASNVYFLTENKEYVLNKEETEKRKKSALSLHRSLFDKAKRK